MAITLVHGAFQADNDLKLLFTGEQKFVHLIVHLAFDIY